MQEWFSEVANAFVQTFITDDRWQIFLRGFGVTIRTAVLALVIGIVLGVLVAIIRTQHDSRRSKKNGIGTVLLNIADVICRIYLTVIRGTPMMVQLMIMYFVIFASTRRTIMVAILAFGINSGAYVAEIFRSGILSIDVGQMEAGRSLGLSYIDTMTQIIMPQAIKNCLPALVNEIIALLKETSICGYIGLAELTRGGDIIRGVTFDALLPLIVVALVYLVIVMFFTWIMSLLERRLRESDIR